GTEERRTLVAGGVGGDREAELREGVEVEVQGVVAGTEIDVAVVHELDVGDESVVERERHPIEDSGAAVGVERWERGALVGSEEVDVERGAEGLAPGPVPWDGRLGGAGGEQDDCGKAVHVGPSSLRG